MVVKKTTTPKEERSDGKRTRTKIIAEVMRDPMQGQREIAKKVGVSKTAVQKQLKRIPRVTKSDPVNKILKKDLSIVQLAQDILEKRLKKPDDISTRDIIASADVSAKRYSLFKGTATDQDGGLKDTSINIKIV